jgi:hypothetical protein
MAARYTFTFPLDILIIINCLTTVLTNLETTFRLTLGYHGGSPSPFETYEGWNFNSGNYLFTTDTK